MGQQGFWDFEVRQRKLESKKEFLIRLSTLVLWDTFCPLLSQLREKPRKSNAGRKPIDVLLLFKMLMLQKFYNISDEDLEYQVNVHLSSMQLLGLGLEISSVPDVTTVWLFRERLRQQELVEALFEQILSI